MASLPSLLILFTGRSLADTGNVAGQEIRPIRLLRRIPSPALAFRIFLIVSFAFSLSATLRSQVRQHFPRRDYASLQFRDALWIGTNRGLYEYRSRENTWSVRTSENGLLSSVITVLAADENTLWIGHDRGVTLYDLGSNTILTYDTSDGIPGGKVLSLAFEADYVWVGTEQGAARYDKLIEEWQTIGPVQGLQGSSVYAVFLKGDMAYLVTEEAVNEYDVRYERWRTYTPGNESLEARDVFLTSSSAWIARENEMLRFDFSSRVFQSFSLEDIGSYDGLLGVYQEGEAFWLLTSSEFWRFDPQANGFRPFLELNLLLDPELHTVAFSPDGGTIWFNTATGLSRYIRKDKTWTYFNEASGMPVTMFTVLFTSGDEIAGIEGDFIHYYKPAEDRWYSYRLASAAVVSRERFFMFSPSQGSVLNFGGGYKLHLTGSRTSWLFRDVLGENDVSKRNDLKLRLELGGGRSINAMYNDADFSDIMYGVQYRGAREDNVQSLQWGDTRVEKGSKQLLQSFGVFGGGGRVVFGEKTPRYHRSLVEISAVEGHKTTALTADFFNGRTKANAAAVRDVDYRKREFFSVETGTAPVDASSLRLFVTVTAGSPATRNLETDTIIAGYAGRWKRLFPVRDFTLDVSRSVVRLSTPLPRGSALAMRYLEGGVTREVLLSAPDSILYELRNVYFLKGVAIIPASLKIRFIDRLGQTVPLSTYGLDGDGDGRVDPRFVDYKNGLLRFPADLPFPPHVYGDSAVSDVTILVRYESMSSGFVLSHDRIVRGSEQILVDGIPARAGDDYVLDYTSGFLLFTRDGVINDDSRIEINYEYTRHRVDERYGHVSAVISPSDYSQVSLTAGRFNEGREDTGGSAPDVWFVNGQVEARYRTEDLDIRVLPEVSRTTGGNGAGMAYGVLLSASSPNARFTMRARRQDDLYTEVFRRWFPFGTLRDETSLRGEYDITPTLRVFADWKRRTGSDTTNGSSASDEFSDVGVMWFDPGLPSITIRGERIFDHVRDSTNQRRGVRGDLQYVASRPVLDWMGFSSVVITSYARYAREKRYLPTGLQHEFVTTNYYLRADLAPRPMFTINSYYRGDYQERDEGWGGYRPYLSTEKLFADVIVEHIAGLSMGARYTNDLRTMFHLADAGDWDADSREALQVNARIFPGQYIDALRPFTFELNFRHDANAYVGGASGARSMFTSLFRSLPRPAATSTVSRLYEVKVEWKPSAEVLYTIQGRASGSTVSNIDSEMEDRRRNLIQRLDFRPGSRSLYSFQFSVLDGENPWSRFTRYLPVLWIENRWSELLLTRLNLTVQYEDRRQGKDVVTTADYLPGGNVTLTFTDPPILERIEIRDDIFYRHTSVKQDPVPYASQRAVITSSSLTNTVYLDLYPYAASYLRLQYTREWYFRSETSPGMSKDTVNLQMVVQL